MSSNNDRKVPVWIMVAIIACMLPALAFPNILSMTAPETPARWLAWFYPFYVLASGVCARICYPERREVTWILLVLMLLSHLAMWLLILNPQQ